MTIEQISDFLDKGLWALLVASISFGVSMLKKLKVGVEELNLNFAVILERFTSQNVRVSERLNDHQNRIERLEDKKR
jgi:hypothetical protein